MINLTMHDLILLTFGIAVGFFGFAIALAKDDFIKLYKEYQNE